VRLAPTAPILVGQPDLPCPLDHGSPHDQRVEEVNVRLLVLRPRGDGKAEEQDGEQENQLSAAPHRGPPCTAAVDRVRPVAWLAVQADEACWLARLLGQDQLAGPRNAEPILLVAVDDEHLPRLPKEVLDRKSVV